MTAKEIATNFGEEFCETFRRNPRTFGHRCFGSEGRFKIYRKYDPTVANIPRVAVMIRDDVTIVAYVSGEVLTNFQFEDPTTTPEQICGWLLDNILCEKPRSLGFLSGSI